MLRDFSVVVEAAVVFVAARGHAIPAHALRFAGGVGGGEVRRVRIAHRVSVLLVVVVFWYHELVQAAGSSAWLV